VVKEEVVDADEVWWLLKPLVERCDGPDPLPVVAGIEKLGPTVTYRSSSEADTDARVLRTNLNRKQKEWRADNWIESVVAVEPYLPCHSRSLVCI